ncbi:MAG: hypothetical protein GX620_02395 [Chloroflexi bacterium]|nr:hypothetical protein [Chloroflexota bacterium]
MGHDLIILMAEAVIVYLLVLWTHSLRSRVGLGPFYALLGGITAIMSWVTDAGVQVSVGHVTFVVGSTVFYTSLLLGVFVVYVFDGPHSTRIAILTVAGVSAMVPIIALALHLQMHLMSSAPLGYVPTPSLRINVASVLATIADLVFLAIAWEFLGRPEFRVRVLPRAYATLLGVMWLDVFLFATGAFAGTPQYLSIMKGTLASRFVISLFAFPFLYAYLSWQNRRTGAIDEHRPVLAILREIAEVRAELSQAQREIELRREAEEESRRLLAQIEAQVLKTERIIDTVPDAMLLIDTAGNVRVANPAARRALPLLTHIPEVSKMTPPEPAPATWQGPVTHLVGTPLSRLLSPPPAGGWHELRAGGRVFELIAHPVPGGTGIEHWVLLIRDVTQERIVRDQLQQSQRLAAVGQLVSGIAHEFNNLMAVILLRSDMMRNSANLSKADRATVDVIREQAHRAARLTQQMLDFSRRSSIERISLDLADFVTAHLAEDLSDGIPAEVRLRLERDDGPHTVNADPSRIHQVISNLTRNACEAMPEGGELTVSVTRISLMQAELSPKPGMASGSWIKLSVADTGVGIPKDVLPHLFEPFFTTRAPLGSGLGLAQVHGIVGQHEGHIVVETSTTSALNERRGTTVSIYLPAA